MLLCYLTKPGDLKRVWWNAQNCMLLINDMINDVLLIK